MSVFNKKRLTAYSLQLTAIILIIFSITSCGQRTSEESRTTNDERRIEYYTCGMHPSVKVSVEEYNKGNKNCPICNMNLTPVYKEEAKTDEIYYGCGVDTEGQCPHCDLGQLDAECICGQHSFIIKGQKINCPVCARPLRKLTQDEVDKLKGVVSRVKIKGEQIRLAGVQTKPVIKLHLYKEIRTVGRVAYDPELAIAQEEFIASLKALDKIQEGNIEEINERALNLVESSKRKLRLLGLSGEQIIELEEEREIQTSLILPEEKMWIYGDVYEYELGWVKVDAKVKVTTSSLPGDEFYGVIISINPVLDPKTRSLRFRAEVDNPGLRLKPEMYVDVVIMSMYRGQDGEGEVLAIPKDAVLDTGVRRIVWIDKGDQEYEGRIIKIGPEATGVIDGQESRFYPVLKGLIEGENIVTKANFLIDSQSQISGVAAAAYGGTVGVEEGKGSAGHQH